MTQTKIGWRPYVPTTYPTDADATAFITAAGLTNTNQQTAINTLVNELKLYGIWAKMRAIYPFVGGSATTHKFNLKDPRDVDAAFRLVFNGGWTHTSTGATPNGTTGYANTYLNPYVVFGNSQTHLVAGSTHSLVHVSKYSRTNSIPLHGYDGVSLGSGDFSRGMLLAWSSAWGLSNGAASLNGWAFTNPRSSVTLGNSTDGFFVINRDSFTSLKSFRNNTLISTNTNDIRSYNEIGLQLNLNPNGVFLIGSLNDAYDGVFRPNLYNSFETSFQTIGWSLTDAEAAALYTAVQKYQTILNRQIGTPVLPEGQVAKLLDNYTTANAAYSLRKLRTSYTGSAIRVRRSSDNTEQNIGFNSSGDLDTASLLSFVGSGNGFVTTFYDQSLNGRNSTQTTATSQPRIVINGSISMQNGKPALYFDGANSWLICSPFETPTYQSEPISLISVMGLNTGYSTSGTYCPYGTYGSNQFRLRIINNKYGIYNGTTELLSTIDASSGQKIISNIFSSTDKLRVNGVEVISGNSGNIVGTYFGIGRSWWSGWNYNGYVQELVVYTSDQISNVNGLETNINSYYSVY